ncbi:hypothetical protein ACI780_20860 [Geodermatophilus sp. SYSU D00814]
MKYDVEGGKGEPLPPQATVSAGSGQVVRFVDPSTPEGAVVMLPDRIDETAGPVYHDDAVGVVKTLRAQGHNVQAASISGSAQYISEYGVTAEIVSSIVLGVAGNLTYDTIKTISTLVRLRVLNALHGGNKTVDKAQVQLSLDELSISEKGAIQLRGLSYTGTVEGVVPALTAVIKPGAKGNTDTASA